MQEFWTLLMFCGNSQQASKDLESEGNSYIIEIEASIY